jgi:hypothetical protein
MTDCSNGNTAAVGLRRTMAAVTNAATSTHLTVVVAPLRRPVIGDRIDPDTSGQTYTWPSIRGTLAIPARHGS